jgi:hypothetical protein
MLSDDKSNNEPENSTNWEQFSLEKDNFLLDRILMRRLAQRRIRFGILGIVLGLMIFVLADVIALALINSYYFKDVLYTLLISFLQKLGITAAIFSGLVPSLLNYLQFGSVLLRGPIESTSYTNSSVAPGSSTIVSSLEPIGTSRENSQEDHFVRVIGTANTEPDSASYIRTPQELIFKTTNRLNREIGDLGRRGNVNLLIGILTTMVGVGILGYVVYMTANDGEDFGWKSGVHTALRISIALFIQTFAYFFLRLYRTSLEDIKYYQNEITNVESKFLAFQAALESKSDVLVKLTIDILSKTERNFILKKGDSTVGLERERLEKNEIMDLVKEAVGTVAKIRTSTK